MFWIIAISFLAGALTLGLILLFVFCLMIAAARSEAKREELDAQFGP